MKIFRVHFEVELVVAAETEEEAEQYCRQSTEWHEEALHGVVAATEIQTASDIPKGWEGALPWNGEGDATVESYLSVFACEGCVHLLRQTTRYSCNRLGGYSLSSSAVHPLRAPECMARNLFRGPLASQGRE